MMPKKQLIVIFFRSTPVNFGQNLNSASVVSVNRFSHFYPPFERLWGSPSFWGFFNSYFLNSIPHEIDCVVFSPIFNEAHFSSFRDRKPFLLNSRKLGINEGKITASTLNLRSQTVCEKAHKNLREDDRFRQRADEGARGLRGEISMIHSREGARDPVRTKINCKWRNGVTRGREQKKHKM